MKKIITTILITLLLATVTYAETEEIIVEIPQFTVTVNGEVIDTEHSDFPVITYKGITYFPMTSDYLSNMGLDLYFDKEKGIFIKSVEVENITQLEQNFVNSNNVLGSQDTAELLPFDLYVNGKEIDNSQEEYPVILYRNMTYFPMTWHYTQEAFKWETDWSDENGYSIVSIDMVKEEDIQLRNVLSKTEDGLTIDDIRFDFDLDESVLGEWICVDLLTNPVDFKPYKKSWKGNLHYEKLIFFKDGNGSNYLSDGFIGNQKWTDGLLLDDNSGMWTASRYFIVEAFNDEFLFVEHKSGDYLFTDNAPSYYVYKRGIKEDPNTIGHIDLNLHEIETTEVDGNKSDKISYKFEDDPQVLGGWKSVDYLSTPYKYNVQEQSYKGNLFLVSLDFLEKGKVSIKYYSGFTGTEKWTNGLILEKGFNYNTASRYFIKTIKNKEYLFLESKEGISALGYNSINYYVFERSDTDDTLDLHTD
ncbi:hypothetical protein EZV73_00090 [Acidaminobacter sp. JC074]|uniref:hypothetical protein n=1 Tax=Acidaminobacter sp. JC074 TaxID=2530199 RepID=UPI001F117E4B|nr:hypothetical protein [Acidaminobacter sp. JC074]MCH4885937.1 hypothetical protein [Acidaminobacter sp. JC074]